MLRTTPDSEAPTLAQGASAWSELCAALDARAELDARILDLTGEVQRSGTIETIEGVPLDTVLALTHRLTQADRSMLLTATDVLRDMSATRRLLGERRLSWSQVRGIVTEACRLTRDERAALDARIAASGDMLTKLDPDDALDAVRVAAAEVRDPKSVERREQAQQRGNFVWAQPGMFDRGRIYGELDNTSLGSVVAGADAMAPADDGRRLSQRRADGLVALARHRCDGTVRHAEVPDHHDADDGVRGDAVPTARRTRHPKLGGAVPDVTVLIDWRDITTAAAGMLIINAPGCVPTISAALLESLVADGATVRAVITDGAQPLLVTSKVQARRIPADVRAAVKARDRADRFPASRRPIDHLHHTDAGVGHHVDHLVGLANSSHRRVHRHGWKISVDPPTGEITFTRGERSWTTLPRGTRLRRPPPADDEAA